jgi:uncharacterized protein YceH (UPF0502 family)
MSSDPLNPAAAPAPVPVLSLHERRILGVLVEKAKTTPDTYPLSLNALATGCNQKSNRDPVLNLSETDVEEALLSAQKKGLAIKITGGRVERWRHALYEAWRVGKVELAVLAELLLRGPQTEGELRGRASRMEPVDDLDALRAVLRPLVERRLVVYLTPEGRRGTVVTHGFHPPEELERLRTRHSAEAAEEAHVPAPSRVAAPVAAPSRPEKVPALENELAEARAEIAALRAVVTDLQASVAGLAEQVRALKEGLGG